MITTNSLGQRIAQTDEQIRAFWRWFGKSKIVDPQGRPLVVYHGTGANFEAFRHEMTGHVTQAASARGGFFFTADEPTAKAYATFASEDAPVQGILRRADAAERRGDWDMYDRLIKEAEDAETQAARETRRGNARVLAVYLRILKPLVVDAAGKTPQELSEDENIDSWLSKQVMTAKSRRLDGVVMHNLDDAVGLYDRPADHFTVFAPTQIKSVNNSGTWNKSDPIMNNPLTNFSAGGTLVKSDRRWKSLAGKGYELMRRCGIFARSVTDIALVEVDSAKPNTVIGALAYYPVSNRGGRLVLSFDLAVDERHRGRGVGRLLIDGVMNIIAQHAAFSTEPHVEIDVNVVNDRVMESLRRRGFTIKHHPGLGEWHATKVIR